MSPPITDQSLSDSIAESFKHHAFIQSLLSFQKEIGLRYDPATVIEIMHKHDLFWYAQSNGHRDTVYVYHVNGGCIASHLRQDANAEDLYTALSHLLGIPALLWGNRFFAVISEVETVDADETPLKSVEQKPETDSVTIQTPNTESNSPSPELPSKSLDDPLTSEEVESIRDILKAQTPAVKRDYPIKFKGAFPGLVPDDARAVTPYHLQYRHALFFQDYINELEGIPAAG
jgi:hypothetical protein